MFGLFSKKKWSVLLSDEAVKILNIGGYQWIDVREPSEYKNGHIPGSKNIPLGSCRRT